jgi:hypothetical protein
MTVTDTIDVRRASRPSAARRPPVNAPARARAVTPLHTEREAAPPWMRTTGAGLSLAGAVFVGVVLAWPGSAPEVALVIPALLAVLVGVLVAIAQTGLDVTADAVVLRFRPLPPVTLRRDRIADVRLVEAAADTFGGLGLRAGRGWRAALLTPGVGIAVTDHFGRSWFVRTGRPDDAMRALGGDTDGPAGDTDAAAGTAERTGGTVRVGRARIG